MMDKWFAIVLICFVASFAGCVAVSEVARYVYGG